MRKGLVGVGLALLLVAPGSVALVLGVEPGAALTLLWIGLAIDLKLSCSAEPSRPIPEGPLEPASSSAQ